jgi:hypothetical protein
MHIMSSVNVAGQILQMALNRVLLLGWFIQPSDQPFHGRTCKSAVAGYL